MSKNSTKELVICGYCGIYHTIKRAAGSTFMILSLLSSRNSATEDTKSNTLTISKCLLRQVLNMNILKKQKRQDKLLKPY